MRILFPLCCPPLSPFFFLFSRELLEGDEPSRGEREERPRAREEGFLRNGYIVEGFFFPLLFEGLPLRKKPAPPFQKSSLFLFCQTAPIKHNPFLQKTIKFPLTYSLSLCQLIIVKLLAKMVLLPYNEDHIISRS